MGERFLRRTIDDEEIWVDLEQGEFFGLNETAARILALVREGVTSPAAISARLVDEFDVELDQAREAVETLLAEARKRGLTDA
jgi:hypothetical protein